MKKIKINSLASVSLFVCTLLNAVIIPAYSKTPNTMSATLPIVSAPNFKMYPCKDETNLKSKNGKPININFINNTSSSVKLYWLDFTGKRVSYSNNLPISVTYQQPSFAGHPWLITDLNDKCLGIYLFSKSTDVKLKSNK